MNRRQVLKHIVGSDMPRVKVVENQTVPDIMKLIKHKHAKTAADYDAIAEMFWKGNVYDTAEALFNFCKENIAYSVESEETQTISQPKIILTRGKGDCKHYSLFIGGVLDALTRLGHPIDWVYRFASYNPLNDTPGHVFIVIKESGGEIWIDPVLDSFDYHKLFFYATDKKITATKPAAMSGIILPHRPGFRRPGLSQIKGFGVLMDQARTAGLSIGATTSQTGTAIMKVAPALAAVPVVGWIAGAAAEVVGGIISIVGSQWAQSPDVRWLTQLFEYYVKNIPSATSDNKTNPADDHLAQAYFSVVLGVPIGGRKDFNILQSGDGNTNTPTGQTAQQRAQNYLNWKGFTSGQIPLSDAINAANIAANLNPNNYQAGGWANLTASPWVVSQDASGNYSVTNTAATSTGTGVMSAGLFGNLPTWAIPVLLVGVLLLFTSPKKKGGKR